MTWLLLIVAMNYDMAPDKSLADASGYEEVVTARRVSEGPTQTRIVCDGNTCRLVPTFSVSPQTTTYKQTPLETGPVTSVTPSASGVNRSRRLWWVPRLRR